VRDLLHVRDLFALLEIQLGDLDRYSGGVFNVGGGRSVSLSLLETTELCRKITGKTTPIDAITENRVADVPVYLTDNARVEAATGWKAATSPEEILTDIFTWAQEHEVGLRGVFG
jgi:CDP-paratose 2-epimerase